MWIARLTGVLLLATGVFVFSNRPKGESSAGSTARVAPASAPNEEPPPPDEAINTITRTPFKPSRLKVTPEEDAAPEDVEAATQEMTQLLDDGDELQALKEARNLQRHANRDVRLEAFLAMDWIGLPAAMDMAGMIDDEDDEIRTAARDAFWKILNEMNSPTVQRDLLSTALQSPDPEMRESVLDELINIPDGLSFELLAKTMLDADEDIADLARENAAFVSGETFESYEDAMRWFKENKQNLDQGEPLQTEQDSDLPSRFFRQKK